MYIHANAMGPLSLVLFLSHTLISPSLTAAQTCYTTGNFTTNSTYGQNRNLILSSLPSNVTANQGFYAASIGQDSDKVYALALCRGDISSENCHDCVNSTAQNLIKNCTNQKEAIMWADGPQCIVRYSNRDIFGLMEVSPSFWAWNMNNISSDLDQFEEKWTYLMNDTMSSAAMGSSRLKFAIGKENLGESTRIYALVQCTPDLSQSECGECLQGAVGTFQECCHGKQGGAVLRPSCFMRSELYPFYESSAYASPPSPPPYPRSAPRKDDAGQGIRTNHNLWNFFITIFVILAFY